jgi:hypothetical protein
MAPHQKRRWKVIKKWLNAPTSETQSVELQAVLLKNLFQYRGLLGEAKDWDTVFANVLAFKLGAGREVFRGKDILGANNPEVLKALGRIIQAACELLPDYVLLKALFSGFVLALRSHGDWYGDVAMKYSERRAEQRAAAEAAAAAGGAGGTESEVELEGETEPVTQEGYALARLVLRFGDKWQVGRVESCENVIKFAAPAGDKTTFGGVNLQPPSNAGRQVVDLPIPDVGAYLYNDFAGTRMCHSVR